MKLSLSFVFQNLLYNDSCLDKDGCRWTQVCPNDAQHDAAGCTGHDLVSEDTVQEQKRGEHHETHNDRAYNKLNLHT